MSSRLLNHEPEIYHLMTDAPSAAPQALEDLALAVELLEQTEAGEPEAWLVDLIDRAAAPRRAARPHVVALGGALGWLARRALRRADLRRAASLGRAFGLELEGLSAEDQWLALARRFLQLARRAAAELARQPAGAPQSAAAHRALTAAAAVLAPGLLRTVAGPSFRRGRVPAVLDPRAPLRAAAAVSRPPEGV